MCTEEEWHAVHAKCILMCSSDVDATHRAHTLKLLKDLLGDDKNEADSSD